MATDYTQNIGLGNPDGGDCNWDDEWYMNTLVPDAVMKALLLPDYIVSGVVPSVGSGLFVDMGAGSALIDGVEYDLGAGSIEVYPGTADEYQWTLIFVNASGIHDVTKEGIASANFTLVALALSDETQVLMVKDLRKIIPDSSRVYKELTIALSFDSTSVTRWSWFFDTSDMVAQPTITHTLALSGAGNINIVQTNKSGFQVVLDAVGVNTNTTLTGVITLNAGVV